MRRKRFPRLSVLSVVLLSTAATGLAQRRALPSRMAAPSTDQAVSAVPTSQSLNFGVTLPLRNVAGLQQLIREQADPKSPMYGKFLTPQEFAAEFGPTEADYQKVISYAKAQGFTVTKTFGSRTLVRLSGSAAAVNKTFNTSMRMYKHPSENRTYHAPSVEPTVDASLPILSVTGLSDRDLPKPMLKKSSSPTPQFATGSGPSNNFLGSDIREAYAPNVTYKGEGQTVALVELGPYNMSDVTSYFSTINQPLNVPIYNVLLSVDGQCTGSPSTGGCDDGEEVIDIEQAISMAPSMAGLLVYEAYGPNSDALTAFTQVANDNVAKQVSLSFGFGGTPSTQPGYEQVFMQLAAQGQSVFIASGDSGANVGGIGYPGNSPNVIDVGGTSLTTSGAGGEWAQEVTWVDSTGGWNTQSPIPSFQVPFINAANQGSTSFRNVPDIAAEADFDSYYCANGGCFTGIGGTSLAAPRWAGFLALVNQQASGHPVSFNSQTPYIIGASSNYNNVLHDITEGNDFNSGSPNLFTAVQGYDLVTGWGSPNGQAMIDLLAPPAVVSNTPNFTLSATPASASILPGGSTTATVTLTPTNGFTGPVALAVESVGATPGVTASLDTTTLSGSGQATVTIATTSGTPLGNQLVAVTGTSNGITQTAYIRLAIPDFTLTATSPTLYLNQSSSATDVLTVNGVNGFANKVALSLNNLPNGLTGKLSPASTSTTTTLSLSSALAADTSAGAPLQVTGVSGSTSRTVPSLTVAVSAATGDCGLGTEVDLSKAFNLEGLTKDGDTVTGTGIDGDGFTLSSTILTPSRVLNGTRFKFGATEAMDAVYGTGQTIALPAGHYQSLQLLGTGLNGNQTAQTVVVTYTDGTTATFKQNFSDWFSPSQNLSETEAVAMPYRNTVGGSKDARQFNVYGYTFLLNTAKTVKSFTLPNNRDVVILAATLAILPNGNAVNLTASYNATGIYADGATFPGDGGADGGGAAYSANVLNDSPAGEAVVIGDLSFNFNGAGVPDAVYGTGTPIPLTKGHFARLSMIGTGVQGDQTDQPVVVTYTDGTKTTFTQSFSDWSGFSGYKNESIASKTPYRDLNDGSQDNQAFYLFRYTFAINPLKTVASVTLPNNRNVVIFAMTLDDLGVLQTLEGQICASPAAPLIEYLTF